MNYNFKPLLFIYIKLKKTLLFVLILFFINATHSQTNINGSFTVFGELGNFGNLQLDADAQVFFQNGSTLHMLGATTTINSGAEIFANTSSTQAGTGRILFNGSVAQTINGGNSSAIGGQHPSFINIAINNPNNVSLSSSNTRVTSGVNFINGHLILGAQNLELASDATVSNANASRFVVTNGTGFLAKENFTTSFVFPVGIATSDFTPATVTPSSADNFFVQVKNYQESASDEATTSDGIDRTWNIYSTNGNGAGIALQHNNATNGGSYSANGGDAAAFVTQYQGIQWISGAQRNQGVWQTGTGATGTNASGSVSNSVIHNRFYPTTATSFSSSLAFFSKSTNALTPLPITLLSFDANPQSHLVTKLTWTTINEINNSHFIVETTTDGVNWAQIGEVKGAGTSYEVNNYAFTHPYAKLGMNYYRLTQVDFEGESSKSNIKQVFFNSTLASNVSVYPNPTQSLVHIVSENTNLIYTLRTMEGREVNVTHTQTENIKSLDLTHLPSAVYMLTVSDKYNVQTFKIVLNN